MRKKRNNYAKELFTNKYKQRVVKPKKEKVATTEKMLKPSTYLLNNLGRHFFSFI